MKVYVVANQKGGVGKTSTSLALASILQDKGYKTLFIEADAQCNATNEYCAKMENTATLYDVLLADERCSINDAIQHCERGDIVASDKYLERADETLRTDIEGYYRLQESLSELKGYDCVVIDTATKIDSLSYNCLTCADEVIIPVECDRYSVEGLSNFVNRIEVVKKRLNPKIKIAGILRTRVKKVTNLFRDYSRELEEYSKTKDVPLLKTYIRECSDIGKAHSVGKALDKFNKRGNAYKDYRDFVEELISISNKEE